MITLPTRLRPVVQVDNAARLANLFKVRVRLGHFDPAGPLQQFPMSDVCSDYAKALSNDGPVQSSALLKNVGGTLPLAASTKTVAIIGPNANLSKADTSYYGPRDPCDGKYWVLADAVEQHSGARATVDFGVPSVLSSDTSGIAAAVALAKEADEVILAVGTDLSWAHEEHDAQNITFTAAQAQLIEQVAAAAKKPVVLVQFTATPLDLSAQLANPKIGAVLHVGQPSVTVLGVGELLFGKALTLSKESSMPSATPASGPSPSASGPSSSSSLLSCCHPAEGREGGERSNGVSGRTFGEQRTGRQSRYSGGPRR